MKKLIWLWKGIICGFFIFLLTHAASILYFIYEMPRPGMLFLTMLSVLFVLIFTNADRWSWFIKSTLCMYAVLLVVILLFNNAEIENYFYYLRDGYRVQGVLSGLNFAFILMISLFMSFCGTVASGVITSKRVRKLEEQSDYLSEYQDGGI